MLRTSVSILALAATVAAQVVLPGTQPGENGIELAKVDQCVLCHGGTDNGLADPVFSWSGGMMAQAARDPVFRAALAVANQDVAGVGEYCVRCHAPRGWLEGRSSAPDGSLLTREDLHGVSCELCHHLVDPLSDEAKQLAAKTPPGYGNAMIVVDPRNVVRGPYGDGTGVKPHGVMHSDYLGKSELCANCHNVSNPLQARDVDTQPPHAYGHIERTYSEWALSDFAQRGAEGSCQSCHYPRVEGGGQVSRYEDGKRAHFVQHGPVGGSTWVQAAVDALWPVADVDGKALRAGQERARALLKTAATLEVSFPDERTARVRVTNLTGHKLPTGYPEGRRMWLHVRFLDKEGETLDEVGRYGEVKDTLGGEPVVVPTLLDPERTRVYECLPGVSEPQARRHRVEPGKSFHFVLNDVTVKDNRIPPAGFRNAAFEQHRCAPVGATYADGQHWDDFDLPLPSGTARVEARLLYQSVSWEYVKFLAEENRSDDWGERLHEVWTRTGRCPPEVIAAITGEAR